MPTENRSSNTDPRDVFIRLNPLGLGEAELRKGSTGFEDQRTHSDYLLFLAGYRETHPEPQPHPAPIAWMVGTAFWWTKEEAERDAAAMGLPVVGLGPMTGSAPAEQHQGEPVTLPARKDPTQGWAVPGGVAKADGWNACLDEIAKLGPLYTHAEIERLRKACEAEFRSVETLNEDNQKLRDQLAETEADRKRLRDNNVELTISAGESQSQLAEAHALLRDIELTMDAQDDSVSLGYDIEMRMATILRPSASAEPSAPVEIDERAEFEKHYANMNDGFVPSCYEGEYDWHDAQPCWLTWQARAALERKPS